jgi:hypothetical protein
MRHRASALLVGTAVAAALALALGLPALAEPDNDRNRRPCRTVYEGEPQPCPPCYAWTTRPCGKNGRCKKVPGCKTAEERIAEAWVRLAPAVSALSRGRAD